MYDFIIVGQGIAGSLLSWHLLQEGQNILVIDNFNPSSASNIASGITNPITGRRFVKTWLADEIIPYAEGTYHGFESLFHQSFYHSISIIRLFDSVKAVNDWSVRCDSTEYQEYIKNNGVIHLDKTKVNNEFGGFEISGGTRLDVALFLRCYRDYLKSKNILAELSINAEEVKEKDSSVAINEFEARKIIFCEGADAIHNPYFKFLPFQLAKGECLIVKMEDFYSDKLINGEVFIMPAGNDEYYVGATHEWNYQDDKPSVEGRIELEANLRAILNCRYEIMDQKAAIRPTVKDRRPLIGFHPEHPNIGIFNGMGTKGISLAPYFANHFTRHLLHGEGLNSVADIKRFL